MDFLKEGGKVSLMRVIAFIGTIMGSSCVVCGLVAMFSEIAMAGTALAVGAGMIATAQGFKMGQKAFEKPQERTQ